MADKKAKDADDIMTLAELKLQLAKARQGQSVGCAIALSDDKDAVVLLDIKKKPRQVLAELRKTAKEVGLVLATASLRFGHAEVDKADARTLKFVVNKDAAGGTLPKLTALMRKAGFARIEIMVDEALEADEHEADPAEPAAAPAPGGGITAALAAVAKSGKVWEATLKSVERQVADLHAKLTEAYHGHGFAAELDRAFHAKVLPMLDSMDASLMHKLAEISVLTDPAARNQAVADAQAMIDRCEAYLAGETLIAKLDANPLVPLSIRKTLTASLEAVSRTLDGCAARLAA